MARWRAALCVWIIAGLTACGAPPSAATPTIFPTSAPATLTPAPSVTPPATPTATFTFTPPPATATATTTPAAPPATLPPTPTRRPAAPGAALPETQPLTGDNAAGLARLARWPLTFAAESLLFSASGRGLWVAGPTQAEVWRTRDGVLIRRARGPALSPDGLLALATFGLAPAEAGGPASLMYVLTDLVAGAERTRWPDAKPDPAAECGPNACATLRFAPNSGTVAEIEDFTRGRERPTLKIWGLDGQRLWTAPGVQALTYSPDGGLLVTRRATTPPIDIWRVRDGALLKSLTPGGVIERMALTPDGTRLALAEAAQVQVWRWAEGARAAAWPAPGLLSLAFNADGALLAGAFADRLVLWDAADGRPVWETPLTAGGPAAVTPDGRLVAVLTDNALELWGVPANWRP